METDELLHQGEPDTRALVRAALAALDAMEAIPYERQLGGRDAGARIAHDELDSLTMLGKPDLDGAFERELERVRHQVQHDFFPHVAVDQHGRRERRTVDQQLYAGLLGRGTKDAGEVGVKDLARLPPRWCRFAQFDARKSSIV